MKNNVLLIGKLTRDPEMRSLANARTVTQFSLETLDYVDGALMQEHHTVVVWDRLAEICSQYLAKGNLVAISGRLQTRQWEDDRKLRHWKTEIVCLEVSLLSGRAKRDFAAEAAAQALAAQAARMGVEPHELVAEGPSFRPPSDPSGVGESAMIAALTSIQEALYGDRAADGSFPEADRSWSGGDELEAIAGVLARYGLVPEGV